MWLPEDITAAMEWQAWERLLCPGCGQPRDESMAHEKHGLTYTGEAVICHACEAKAISESDWREAGGSTAGVHFVARRDDA